MDWTHRIEPQAPGAGRAWRGHVARLISRATANEHHRSDAQVRPKPSMELYAGRLDDPRD